MSGTFVPGIAFGPKDGRISLEVGGGIALLNEYKFGNQNLGGPFQFVWDIGVRGGVVRNIGAGYWFQHISDATIYGSQSRGFDLHMVELSYRY
ncbi:MAG: acyloxyacyl hydrolase [Nitrospirae bacterium]|nr:acyloxyacyl hydrolase [Nitrospirota bacterium]